jgi:hypothetical protein
MKISKKFPHIKSADAGLLLKRESRRISPQKLYENFNDKSIKFKEEKRRRNKEEKL